jgi:hypothetical protein
MLFQEAKQHQQLGIVKSVESMVMGQDSAPLCRNIKQYQIQYTMSFVYLPHTLPINVERWMHLQIGWIEQHSR